MKCKLCNQNLVIGDSELVSPLNTTEVSSKMTLLCTNPNCAGYAGEKLNSPLVIAETITKPVGG